VKVKQDTCHSSIIEKLNQKTKKFDEAIKDLQNKLYLKANNKNELYV